MVITKDIMLSADGNVVLYKARADIVDNFDELINEFFEWENTNVK